MRAHTLFLLLVAAAANASAQVMDVRSVTPPSAGPLVSTLKAAQADFEGFHRTHLPETITGRPAPGKCDEEVGRFCYWYVENEPPAPAELTSVREARDRLINRLDSATRAFPTDRWATGQLVRYLVEAGRFNEAVKAAERCGAEGWWCPAERGYALHVAGRYTEAESSFVQALSLMTEKERCEWRDMKILLDDALLHDYRDLSCRDREAFERRVWWLSRPMMSSTGNDARTEYYARVMMTHLLDDGASVHDSDTGFDADERELLLRYSWERAWTASGGYRGLLGATAASITGYEPSPAPPMLPVAATVRNPAFSDSIGWRGKGLPGVRARYAAPYARRLLPLQHQAAIFRRGDSALVVMAYDISGDRDLAAAAAANTLQAALVLTKGEPSDASIVRLPRPGERGTLTATTSWGPMLMSAELAAPAGHVLARARYGMRSSDIPGARVAISDMLIFEPYDGMPLKLEDALAHARSSLEVKPDSRIGIYWETYNTSPTGEGLQVSITVAPQDADGGWLRRGLTALRLVKDAKPVTVGMSDVSARGLAYSPRAVQVDLTTLKSGRYLLQLEITAQGTPTVHAERELTVR